MTRAPIPRNEQRRLEVLWQYDVLDTLPETVFDDLTQLAALICHAPVATLSLVDEHRQWFKSKVGVSFTETARDISFCGHAMLHDGLFIVADALKDARFKDNPFVTGEPRIRFYVGAPLNSPDGHALGALCVIDKIPRELTDDQEKALRILGRHVMALLELRRRAIERKRAGSDAAYAPRPARKSPGRTARSRR
ncbi:MAG TPA: GAF domain-containing protein [Verrucomicrobiae bacterium]|jgi:GAF domain-containing protein